MARLAQSKPMHSLQCTAKPRMQRQQRDRQINLWTNTQAPPLLENYEKQITNFWLLLPMRQDTANQYREPPVATHSDTG